MDQEIIIQIIRQWEKDTADIDDAISKPHLRSATVIVIKKDFPHVAVSFIEQVLDLIYLSDHL